MIPGGKILDIGCRENLLQDFLPAGTEYFGLEVSSTNSSQNGEKNKFLPQGICDDKSREVFGDLKFDAVVLAETLEHLLEPFQALDNIKFLLRDGGQLIGSVPNAVAWRYFFFLELLGDGMNDFVAPKWDGHEHFFAFNKYILRTLLMRAGFKKITIKEWGSWIPGTGIFLPFNFRGSHLIFTAEKQS